MNRLRILFCSWQACVVPVVVGACVTSPSTTIDARVTFSQTEVNLGDSVHVVVAAINRGPAAAMVTMPCLSFEVVDDHGMIVAPAWTCVDVVARPFLLDVGEDRMVTSSWRLYGFSAPLPAGRFTVRPGVYAHDAIVDRHSFMFTIRR
jgi:hypothetical protein